MKNRNMNSPVLLSDEELEQVSAGRGAFSSLRGRAMERLIKIILEELFGVK